MRQKRSSTKQTVLLAAFLLLATPAIAEPPTIDLFGVSLKRGMPESEVREAFPNLNCYDNCDGVVSDVTICGISDGVPPGSDGEVTFKDGKLYQASKNWFLEENSTPYDALLMQNQLLTRLAGEGNAVCAKVETYSSQFNESTVYVFPQKVLSVQMHSRRGKHAHFRESLRVNPVPEGYRVRGKKMRGTEWCGYVNVTD
ncbi:MAG: hypothetical protein AAF431_07710 [Pseudomonadota bacterium]